MNEHYRNGITTIPEARRAIDEGRSWVVSSYNRGANAIHPRGFFYWTLVNRSRRKGLWIYNPLITTPENFVLSFNEGGIYTINGQPYVFNTSNPVIPQNRSRTERDESRLPYFSIYAQTPDLARAGGETPFTQTVNHSSPADIPALFVGPGETYVLSLENLTARAIEWGIELNIEQDYERD